MLIDLQVRSTKSAEDRVNLEQRVAEASTQLESLRYALRIAYLRSPGNCYSAAIPRICRVRVEQQQRLLQDTKPVYLFMQLPKLLPLRMQGRTMAQVPSLTLPASAAESNSKSDPEAPSQYQRDRLDMQRLSSTMSLFESGSASTPGVGSASASPGPEGQPYRAHL